MVRENSDIGSLDPTFRISKREEQQAVIIMGNMKDKDGNRFGKNLKKIYDGKIEGGNSHLIKYQSSTDKRTIVFQLIKAPNGHILISEKALLATACRTFIKLSISMIRL
jgi:hypothetical protein